MNLEMAVTEEMLAIAVETGAAFLLSGAGKNAEEIFHRGVRMWPDGAIKCGVINTYCAAAGIEVSLFIDADEAQINAAAEVGAPFIEIRYRLLRQRRNRCGTGKRAGAYCQRRPLAAVWG